MAIWSDVTRGRSGTVLIAGEAGIGKTRLVAEVAFEVQCGGGRVLSAACHEDELRPFGPFADFNGSMGDGRDGSSAWGLDGPDAAAEQARVVGVLRDDLIGRSRRTSTLLVVEDVH
jgi:predicted ATPase